MRRITFAVVAAAAIVSAGWRTTEATAKTFETAVAPAFLQQSQPLQQFAQASFSGTYEGNVNRRKVASKEQIATRMYRIAVNPDLVNGTVWIYEDGKHLYTLLFKGKMQGSLVFVGTTKPVEAVVAGYIPDRIRLEFSSDGGSVRWYHNDRNLEGSGTLVRR